MTDNKAIPPKLAKAVKSDIGDRIAGWFRAKLKVGAGSEIVVKTPSDGYSGDTYIVSVSDTVNVPSRYVLRAQIGTANNPESYYDNMVRLLTSLAREPAVPVPRVRFSETDETILGGPFFVMEFVDGRPAPDVPPFTTSGWFFEAGAAQRRQAYISGLEAVAKLQAVDPVRTGLEFLRHKGAHASQTRNHLVFLKGLYDAGVEGKRSVLMNDVIAWLEANLPDTPRYVVSWGDCRPGNMLFRDFRCVSMLDWEMCALADPAVDIAWWINSDIYYQLETNTWLEGMLSREEMREAFGGISGDPLANLDYFQVFSGLRIAVIHVHMIQKWARAGQDLFGRGNSLHENPSTRLVRHVVDRVCP